METMQSISLYMVSGFQKDIKENIPSQNWTQRLDNLEPSLTRHGWAIFAWFR